MNRDILRQVLADQKSELFTDGRDEILRDLDVGYHLDSPEVSVITGVRRGGKSTLLRQIARRLKDYCAIHYLNFEEQRLSQFRVDDFQAAYEEFLLAESKSPARRQILIYDEIQLVDGWERWVAGQSGRKNIKVFITGSNSRLLSSELASLLTGRHLPLHVAPLSFREIVGNVPGALLADGSLCDSTAALIACRAAFWDYMQFGGFPRAYVSRDLRILGQYYEDILIKDIAVRKKVRNLPALKSLGAVLASQNGRMLTQPSVARDIAVQSKITVTKFCDYFKETFLYSELRLFSRSKRGQMRGRSRFYAVDPLMARQSGYHYGDCAYWILENHVCNELLRRGFDLYYWHSRRGFEVDFIACRKDRPVFAVQVSINPAHPERMKREVRALDAARYELGITEAFIITADEPEPELVKRSSIPVVPFYRWALEPIIQ